MSGFHSVLALAFYETEWPIFEEALDFSLPRERNPITNEDELSVWHDEAPKSDLFIEAQEKLRKTHHQACLDMGFDYQETEDGSRYTTYKTPAGLRKFAVWQMELMYDPEELFDTPETAIFGIAISSRYAPTFADWEDSHGGFPNPVSPESQEMIIAKKNILEAVPCFEKANWLVVERHH